MKKALLIAFTVNELYQTLTQMQNYADSPPLNQDQQENLRKICRDAAHSLSVDRSTSFISVTIFVEIFLSTLTVAFDKNSFETISINNEISSYYIVHTILYFNILSAILLSAIVGVS